MPKNAPLILFSTSHCHLCESAIAILNDMPELVFTVVEISQSDTLLDRYSMRIPVLQRADNLAELDWPFDIASINSFTSE